MYMIIVHTAVGKLFAGLKNVLSCDLRVRARKGEGGVYLFI